MTLCLAIFDRLQFSRWRHRVLGCRNLGAVFVPILSLLLAWTACERVSVAEAGSPQIRRLESLPYLPPLLIGPAGAFPRWHSVSSKLEQQLANTPGVLRVAERRARRYRGKPARVIVAAIRSYVTGTIRYVKDRPRDQWSDPGRTVQLGTGDCEDQAILGLYMALAAGIPRERAAVAIGRDRRGNQHALLVVLGDDLSAWTFDVADPGSPHLSRSGFQPTLVGFMGEVGFAVSETAARSGTESRH